MSGLVRAPLTRPPARSEGGPYRGQSPFAAAHRDYFFGRERERGEVHEMLTAHRLATLHGPSGAGKSSLLGAGIAGKLLAEARSSYGEGRPALLVPVLFSAWQEDPQIALRGCIRGALESLGGGLAEDLPEGSLVECINAAAALIRGELLIVLDQFEQCFPPADGGRGSKPRGARGSGPRGMSRSRSDGARGSRPRGMSQPALSVGDLTQIVERTEGAARFLVCIRSEALGELGRFGAHLPDLTRAQMSIDHLDRAAAAAAIREPLHKWNDLHGEEARWADVDSDLVDAMLEGVALRDGTDERLPAPYLQIAMRRLWDAELERGSRALRLETLERLGGIRGVLEEHLESAMARLSRRERGVAARVLEPVVSLAGVTVAQLVQYTHLPAGQVRPLLEGLAREPRILRPSAGEVGYEIYSGALAQPIQQWCARQDSRTRRGAALKRVLATAGATACILAAIALVHGFSGLELATLDARFALRGAQRPPANVILVKIDDASLRSLHSEWPLPRRIDAEAIKKIAEQKPRAIAYDVDFSGHHNEPLGGSEELLEALLAATPRVVLAASVPSPQGAVNILGGAENLREVGARVGFSGFETALGETIRRPLYAADGLRSFAVVAGEVAGARPIPSHDFARAWIDYYGPPETLRSVSLVNVLRRRLPRDFLRDKVVVVGVTSPSAGDYHPISGPDRPFASGAEVQATAIANVLRGLPLRDASGWLTAPAIALFVLVSALAALRLRLRAMLAIALGLTLMWLLIAQLAFDGGLVLVVAYPVGALLIGTLIAALVGFTSSGPRRSGEDTGRVADALP